MANLFCGYACIVHSMRDELESGGALHRLRLRSRHAGRPHRPHDRHDQRVRIRVRLAGRRRVVRRRARDSLVPVGPATARADRVGRRLPLRGGGCRPTGALQHPVGLAGQTLLRRHAESGRGVCPGGDGLCLSAGIPERHARRGRPGDGDYPGAHDGEHDSLPQLQDVRPADAPQFRRAGARRARGWFCSPRSRSTCCWRWPTRIWRPASSGSRGRGYIGAHQRQRRHCPVRGAEEHRDTKAL